MSWYRVTGPRVYRGYPTGAVFEANLSSDEEQRAMVRGNITLVERSTPRLTVGSFTPPVWAVSSSTAEGARDV